MSVHLVPRRHSDDGYDVRWRADGRQNARRFEDADDAAAFDEAMRARLALDRATAAYARIPARWREAVDAELAG